MAFVARSIWRASFSQTGSHSALDRRLCDHRAKLVIEVDGGQHGDEADAARTATIEAEGYRVIRFWNHELLGNPDGVWTVIDEALRVRHPTPTPPHQGEGL